MAFPTTPILDDANRSDRGLGNDVASSGLVWGATEWDGSATAEQIISNQFRPAGAGSAYITAIFQPDQEAYVTIAQAPDTTGYIQIACRLINIGTASWSGYLAFCDSSVPSLSLRRVDSGTPTTITSTTSGVPTTGDIIGISCSGTTIYVWKVSGGVTTQLLSIIDSTYTAPGVIGFSSANGSTVSALLDNFGGGNTIITPVTQTSQYPTISDSSW